MAATYWQDVSGDWTAAANWSGGAAPGAGDDVYILEGSQSIVTNLPGAAAGVNYNSITVGPEFEGNIGDDAHILYIGSIVDKINFVGDRCKEAWFYVDAGDTTNIEVGGTNQGPNGLYLYGGTWGSVVVSKSCGLKIGANATVTALYVTYKTSPSTDARVHIVSGATITAAVQTGGIVTNHAAATTVTVAGGRWDHIGDTTYNVTTLNSYPDSVFNFWSEGGTITTWNGYGGTLDTTGGPGHPKTITTANRYAGSTLTIRGTGTITTITNNNDFGGDEITGI